MVLPNRFDCLACPNNECGRVLAQWTDDVQRGEIGYVSKLRPVEITELPAEGTASEDVRCPFCNTRWFPDQSQVPYRAYRLLRRAI